jgi:hypothetical protein
MDAVFERLQLATLAHVVDQRREAVALLLDPAVATSAAEREQRTGGDDADDDDDDEDLDQREPAGSRGPSVDTRRRGGRATDRGSSCRCPR